MAFGAGVESPDDDIAVVGFLRHTLVCADGVRLTPDFTDLPCPRLVRHLTAALAARLGVGGGHLTMGTVRTYVSAIRAFVPLVAARHPGEAGRFDAAGVSAADVDAFEEAQRERFPSDSTTPYFLVGSVVRLLRTAASGRVSLRPDLVDRLDFVANGVKGHVTPRDAYSPAETARLRAACRAEILRVVERLTVVAEQRLALGREPVGPGWRVPENVTWHIDRHGPISRAELQERQGRLALGFRWADVHRPLYPSHHELVPFLLLFALESGIELEGCKDLRADCLGRAEGGRVEVHYRKRRAGVHQWRTVWVRDAGMYSPGRLIRMVLRLTHRARPHCGSDLLWLAFGGRGGLGPVPMTAGSGVFAEFVARHDLRGDDGRPLRLQPVRLRKTHKAGRYLATQGQLPDFAGGNHTTVVAAEYYAAIEALRPLHEAAIERALRDAVAVARRATVVTAAEEAALAADPEAASEVLGVPPAEVRAFLGGEQDVWLASCRDFFDSPFGTPGAPCPTPFWSCLSCPNAVLTTRKLPALLSFLAHVVDARRRMPAEQWAATYGEAHRQLVEDVLPRFPPAVVAAARAAADLDPELLYLPPQLSGSRP
ncbi:MAG: hypothetical protein ACLGI2_13125 [Acidimicrobiia bacterium]